METMNVVSAREIITRGTRVFFTHTIRAVDLEQWVLRVATTSGQDLAWIPSHHGAWIFALGDIRKVLLVMQTLREEHDQAFKAASDHRAGLSMWVLETEIWGPVGVLLQGFQGLGQTAGLEKAPNPQPEHLPENSGSTILTLQLDDDD